MPDDSHLDQRYFIDDRIYNCPYCNRRHLAYYVKSTDEFDWSDSKRCSVYFVKCSSCSKVSMHLSFGGLGTQYDYQRQCYLFKDYGNDEELDSRFFYSVPTSFFVLDSRIPRILRELMAEAEGCLKSNFLTGASACARKIVYELGVIQQANGDNYEDRIKSLKEINPGVDANFFDTLLTIQQVTSTKVHEESYDGWEAKHLKVILSALKEVLQEIFVSPAVKADKRSAILKLKDELLGRKTAE